MIGRFILATTVIKSLGWSKFFAIPTDIGLEPNPPASKRHKPHIRRIIAENQPSYLTLNTMDPKSKYEIGINFTQKYRKRYFPHFIAFFPS